MYAQHSIKGGKKHKRQVKNAPLANDLITAAKESWQRDGGGGQGRQVYHESGIVGEEVGGFDAAPEADVEALGVAVAVLNNLFERVHVVGRGEASVNLSPR